MASVAWREAGPEPQPAAYGVTPPAAGDFEAVLDTLDQSLAWQPDAQPMLLARADVLRYLGRADEALRVLDGVLARDPRSAPAWYLRGLGLGRFLGAASAQAEPFDARQNDEAVEAFDRALLLSPDFYEARLYKGLALYRSCHAAQSALNALGHAARRVLDEASAHQYLRPLQLAYGCYFERALESLGAAAKSQRSGARLPRLHRALPR